MNFQFQYNDGGADNFDKSKGCVIRAIAIATREPYQKIKSDLQYDDSRGIHTKVYTRYLKDNGWEWVSILSNSFGYRIYDKCIKLPQGRIIVSVPCHLSAVINHVVNDVKMHDCLKSETQYILGYFKRVA